MREVCALDPLFDTYLTQHFALQLIQATSFIVGSALGAGILAFPVVTSLGGYLPSLFWSFVVAIALGKTAILLAQRVAEVGEDAHIPTLCRTILGRSFETIVLWAILLHYGALMIAYCSAGTQLVASFFPTSMASVAPMQMLAYLALIGGLSLLKPAQFFLANLAMTIGLGLAYFGLIGSGWNLIRLERLGSHQMGQSVWTLPIFFSAFGFHSVVPSVCRFCRNDQKRIRRAIWLGVFLIWLVVILWQTLVMGAVDLESLRELLHRGQPATSALARFSSRPALIVCANLFAFFAIITSHTGVVFALRDFLWDFLRAVSPTRGQRVRLTFALICLPMVGAALAPDIFETALTFSGGIGSTTLNGFVPVLLSLNFRAGLFSAVNWRILPLALFAIGVMGIEIGNLIAHRF